MIESVVLSLEVSKKEDQAMKFLADNMPSNRVPMPPKLPNYGECEKSNENMESSTWFK